MSGETLAQTQACMQTHGRGHRKTSGGSEHQQLINERAVGLRVHYELSNSMDADGKRQKDITVPDCLFLELFCLYIEFEESRSFLLESFYMFINMITYDITF